MRLDKWLKVSRVIKRRTVANEACDKEKIKINGRVAKASYEVKQSDKIEISLGNRVSIFEILGIPEKANVTTQEAKELYNLISESVSKENEFI